MSTPDTGQAPAEVEAAVQVLSWAEAHGGCTQEVADAIGVLLAERATVQAPDVAALPPEVVAVIEAARVWVANNHRAGHTPTGPAARLYDAVCALLGTARAVLGADANHGGAS